MLGTVIQTKNLKMNKVYLFLFPSMAYFNSEDGLWNILKSSEYCIVSHFTVVYG